VQVEEPEIRWVPNGDAPKSRTVSLVLSMENDRDSLENLESSEPRDSQNFYLNVEAPDDGHIFLGPGRRINCLLPNLCVADKDNIRVLVTSVVYQPYTWGIILPTIGIEIEGDRTTAQGLIGWVNEKDLQTVEQLVRVAIGNWGNTMC
jgi:hypothetical protein